MQAQNKRVHFRLVKFGKHTLPYFAFIISINQWGQEAGKVYGDNRHRVDKMLHVLRDELGPFVLRVYKDTYKAGKYLDVLKRDLNKGKHPQLEFCDESSALKEADVPRWLNCISDNSRNVFRFRASRSYTRSRAEELLNARNIWAHQGAFEDEEMRRVADTAALLLEEIGRREKAQEIRAIARVIQDSSAEGETPAPQAAKQRVVFAPIDSSSVFEDVKGPLKRVLSPLNQDYLNEQQRAAVTAGPEGPILVNAGPGSGKTKVLIERVVWLVQEQGVPPDSVLGMTFTKKATAEMESRVLLSLGPEWGKSVRIGTIHSICWEILRKETQHLPWRRTPLILDKRSQRNVVVTALRELEPDKHRFQFPKRTLVDNILAKISTARSRLIQPEHYRESFHQFWNAEPEVADLVNRVYPLYLALLQDSNTIDFNDQLVWAEKLLRENRAVREKYQDLFRYVLVDEFQDLNRAQYILLRHFGLPQNNIFVVGDEDQSIYGWNGADQRNFDHFRRDYPHALIMSLEQNYRSTQHILDLGKKLTSKNAERQGKDLFTTREDGIVPQVGRAEDETQEATLVAQKIEELVESGHNYRDCAVLCRQAYPLQLVQDALEVLGAPSGISGDNENRLFGLDEVQDLLAYLRLCIDPDHEFSFLRVLNAPKRNIGPKTRSQFHMWRREEKLSIDEALSLLVQGVNPKLVRQVAYLREFAKTLRELRVSAQQECMTLLFDRILLQTNYKEYLRKNGPEDKARERESNLVRLRQYLEHAVEQGKDLEEFLKSDELAAIVFDERESQADAVPLMTLHNSKGLEFQVVFIIGLEEDLLPDYRSVDDPEKLAEEGRLLYVGLTRAKDQLYLSWASSRKTRSGVPRDRLPSRFLKEIVQAPSPTSPPQPAPSSERDFEIPF